MSEHLLNSQKKKKKKKKKKKSGDIPSCRGLLKNFISQEKDKEKIPKI